MSSFAHLSKHQTINSTRAWAFSDTCTATSPRIESYLAHIRSTVNYLLNEYMCASMSEEMVRIHLSDSAIYIHLFL